MKTSAFSFVLLLISVFATAQSPMVGTWEMVSGKGTDADGTKISFDEFSMREVKIITPTHYMIMSHRVTGDSLTFDKALAGTIKVTGNKFVETPLYASNPDDMKIKTDFTWKVAGDKLIQSGVITLADGRKVKLDELVFSRMKAAESFDKSSLVGVWDQLSAGFTFEDGTKGYHTKATAVRFQIMNGSHHMTISMRDGQFENARGGTYTIEGGSIVPTITVASYKLDPNDNTRYFIDQRIDGNILYLTGHRISPEGKEVFTWDDVYLRVGK